MDPTLSEIWKKFEIHREEKLRKKAESKMAKSEAQMNKTENNLNSTNKRGRKSMKVQTPIASKTPGTNFGVLKKIVNHLEKRFLSKDDTPTNLDEILNEIRLPTLSHQTKQWLMADALPNNPAVRTYADGSLRFQPPLKCRNKSSLIRTLETQNGGLFLHDVVKSVPNADKILKHLSPDLIQIKRRDKKTVLFYDDHYADLCLDEDIKEMWRSVEIEGTDDGKIEEYLITQHLRPMRGIQANHKSRIPVKTQRKHSKKLKKPKDNQHVANDLMTFEF